RRAISQPRIAETNTVEEIEKLAAELQIQPVYVARMWPRTCCPQKRGDVKRPPSPSDIHDAGRQAQMSSQRGNRMASCACGRLPEPRSGWVPASQDLMTNEAGPGCNGLPTRWPSSSDGVR